MIGLSSLNAAPFGPSELLDVSALERVDPSDSEGFIRTGMPTG